jgi:hypothetical protein
LLFNEEGDPEAAFTKFLHFLVGRRDRLTLHE